MRIDRWIVAVLLGFGSLFCADRQGTKYCPSLGIETVVGLTAP